MIYITFTCSSAVARRPHSCNCMEFVGASSPDVYELNLHESKNCTADSPSMLSLSRKVSRRKSYGVIQVDLTEVGISIHTNMQQLCSQTMTN